MKNILPIKKFAVAATLAVLLASTSAHANEMINNSASGVIDGQLRQTNQTYMTPVSAEVGSISANVALNNRADGYVGGDVLQNAKEGAAELRVGSINAHEAFDNTAEGRIDGTVYQDAAYGDVELSVGSIAAERANANTAFGYIAGDAIQENYGHEKVKARVGSIGPK